MRRRAPRLPELLIRALLVGAVLIVGARFLQTDVVRPLLPVFGTLVNLLAPPFALQSLEVVDSDPAVVRVRANLLEPVEFAGHTVTPVGWLDSETQGGYEVSLSMTGLLQYPVLALLVLLAWPAAELSVIGLRVILALPLAAALLLTEAPTTIVGELWSMVRDQADPAAVCYWMVWSRFLMGGGGMLISLLLGIGGLYLAGRLRRGGPVPDVIA